MLDVIATDLAKSRLSSGAVTACTDSELVRTTWPTRGESLASAPERRQSASNWFVPSAPAATTTPLARDRLASRAEARTPERALVTA